jgi:putative flippase GtrA
MVSTMQPRTSAAAPALARFTTFARSALTGGAATLADLAVIAVMTGLFHTSPKVANVPALLVGAVVQFFGNKHFAFRARGGNLRRQAALFVATEAVALGLNAALYHGVASLFPLVPATAVLARAITTNLVFLLWSYPVWKRVFAAHAPRVAA